METIAEAGQSVPSLATERYNAAAKAFVNKDFVYSLDALEPLVKNVHSLVQRRELSLKTKAKVYILYASLCGIAVGPFSCFEANQRRRLALKITQGTFWKEDVLVAYPEMLDLPAEVVLCVSKLMVLHSALLKPTVEALETWVSLASPERVQGMSAHEKRVYKHIIELFVRELLCDTGEFEYANALLTNSTVLSQTEVAQLKGDLQTRFEKRLREEHETKLQRERLAQQEIERVKRAQDREVEVIEPTVEEKTPENENQKQNIQSRPREVKWQTFVAQLASSQRMHSTILMILLFLAAVSNRQLRKRVAAGSSWLWRSVVASVKMGLTVTYL